jgi:Tol biopolymer transport system component
MARSRIPLLAGSLSLLLIAIVLIAQSASNSDSPSSSSPGAGESAEEPHSEASNIFVVDVRTRSVAQITRNHGSELSQSPSWSSRGKLAFSQAPCDECAARILITDGDGSNRRVLRTRETQFFQPSWSPDGRRLAVTRLGVGIYAVDVAKARTRRLTKGDAHEAPAWSPDGRTVLFDSRVRGTNYDLFSVPAVGGPARRLTRDRLQQTNPTWSPAGQRIAFAEQQRTGNWVIYSSRRDGSGSRRLTDGQSSSQEPAWSPNGKRIAFIAQTGRPGAVAVMNATGGKPTIVTGPNLLASRPTWSPDNTKIAFAAKRVAPTQ